jgi:small subunit ribosomal protein S3
MMVVEKLFVKEGIKESEVEEFLRNMFERAGYSHTEISRTPLGTRIIVYASKPELVIGRSGRRINEITNAIKDRFGFENPLVDVKEIGNPFLDSSIVARRIAKALERGINYKKVANYYLQKIMESGAVGVQIIMAGKLAARSRTQKFKEGFVAHSGDYAEKLVDYSYTQAILKLGIIGIKVRIMKEMPREVEKRTEEKKS